MSEVWDKVHSVCNTKSMTQKRIRNKLIELVKVYHQEASDDYDYALSAEKYYGGADKIWGLTGYTIGYAMKKYRRRMNEANEMINSIKAKYDTN